jgi:hypothetical protein
MEMLLGSVEVPVPSGASDAAAVLAQAAGDRHRLIEQQVDLDGYAQAGLPASTMGRDLDQDPLFFAAALAAGASLRRKG